MAKHFIVFLIRFYQLFVSPILSQTLGIKALCRYNPSCSEYTLQMVKKHGLMKGVKKGLTQLSHCHPYEKVYGAL